MEFPTELKYTKEHEWIKVDGNIAVVGITAFAQQELGDIVYVDIPQEGDDVAKDDVFGSIEAVKTVSDLFMPVSGKVLEKNVAIDDEPELVNQDPYGKGWIIKIEISNPAELDDLLDADAYKEIAG